MLFSRWKQLIVGILAAFLLAPLPVFAFTIGTTWVFSSNDATTPWTIASSDATSVTITPQPGNFHGASQNFILSAPVTATAGETINTDDLRTDLSKFTLGHGFLILDIGVNSSSILSNNQFSAPPPATLPGPGTGTYTGTAQSLNAGSGNTLTISIFTRPSSGSGNPNNDWNVNGNLVFAFK
jgi:hypothetical protein